MRYLIDFSYSGANFNGYQKQKGLRTVQEDIEMVLTMINNNNYVKLVSSGRTDAKVNALHQVAHFDLNINIGEYKLKGALNSYLSDDIHINSVKTVDCNFHARYMVKKKTYEYKINTGNYNPLEKDYVYQYCKKLDIHKMKQSIKSFIGTHDFTTFASGEDKKENKIRTIYKASVKKKGDIIIISFTGSGFLKYQVRNMVGLLIKIGEEKKDIDISNLLMQKDRKKIGLTAKPNGLTLVKVEY